MLRLVSAITLSLDVLGTNSSFEEQHDTIARYFSEPIRSEILRRGDGVFHRHQLLFLMQEVAKACPDLAPSEDGSTRSVDIGEVFLMASDHLSSPVQLSGKLDDLDMLELILSFVPVSEANIFTHPLLKMGRSHLMVTRFAEARRGQSGFFDISSLFQKATGLPFDTFEALMATIFTRLVRVDGRPQAPLELGVPLTYFDKLPITADEKSAFFDLVSATPADYEKALKQLNPRINDFRVIRDKPLARIGDACFPLDAYLGMEKFETAVYWSIFQSLTDDQKKSFPSFWGNVFEDYVLWLLGESCDGKKNRLHKNPKYAKARDQEVCDAIVVCGRTAVLIEIKGNTVTSEGKYASDAEQLRAEIEKKYVGIAKPKGVRQLVIAAQNICGDGPAEIEGVDLTYITRVIPVLITRDDIGGYFGLNTYLNSRFREILGPAEHRISISDCLCICSDTLEKLTPYLCDTVLAEILSSRLRNDKALRSPFFSRLGGILKKRNRGNRDRNPAPLKDANYAIAEVVRRVFRVQRP